MSYAAQLKILHHVMVDGASAPMLTLIKPVRHNVCSPETRLGVYTHGYTVRLEGAVEMDYPALEKYMGKDAFDTAVAAYVKATPSVFWDLNLYSIAFADFMKTHSDDTATHALASLESALIDVYWLPDSEALDPAALATLTMDALAEKTFQLRAASTLLALEYTANAYVNGGALEKKAEYLCVIRAHNKVQCIVLDEAEHALLTALKNGASFGAALDAAKDAQALAVKLPGYLARWLDIGMLSL